jgi:hypothetical protein
MSDHRSDRVWLANDTARCEPSAPGQAAHRCARYLAALPQFNAWLEDFSLREQGCTPLCQGFTKPERQQMAKPAPRVFGGF